MLTAVMFLKPDVMYTSPVWLIQTEVARDVPKEKLAIATTAVEVGPGYPDTELR